MCIFAEPYIANCPVGDVPLPAIVSPYSNKAVFNFQFVGRDWRGARLDTFIQQREFFAQNKSHDSLFHNRAWTVNDMYGNRAECCFYVELKGNSTSISVSFHNAIVAFENKFQVSTIILQIFNVRRFDYTAFVVSGKVKIP